MTPRSAAPLPQHPSSRAPSGAAHSARRLLDDTARVVHAADALSAELADFRVCAMLAGVSELRGSWGLDSPPGAGGFYALLEGAAVVTCEAAPRPIHLAPGDVLIIAPGHTHAIKSDLRARSCSALEVFGPAQARTRAGVRLGASGPLTRFLCGALLLEPAAAAFPALPHVVLCDAASRLAEPDPMRDAIAHMVRLCQDQAPGTQALLNHLGAIVLIQAIRLHLARAERDHADDPVPAILDAHVGPTIGLMRHRPEQPWSLEDLANEAGLSRTAYHERFVRLVGRPPLRFLREVRMARAARRLRAEDAEVRDIAHAVGYSSESAFSAAFKRWSGRSPIDYRRDPAPLNQPTTAATAHAPSEPTTA